MRITYKTGTRFAVETRGHDITVDLPPDKGGTDQGMTPPELLAASLGTCIGIYVTQYCKQIGVNSDDTTVDVKWEMEEQPLRIGRLQATVNIPGGVPPERRNAIQKVAEHCLVHQTLCNMPELDIELQ